MPVDFSKLDNPAWHALTERHAGFALGTVELKRYDPAIVLFAGFGRAKENISEQFDEVFAPGDSFFLFDDYPALPSGYEVETIVQCMQMVCETPVPVAFTENMVHLDTSHHAEMFTLVTRYSRVITCRALR